MSVKNYEEAGVSIDKGDRFAEFISSIKSSAVSKGIGGFAGGIELDLKGYTQPVLLSATDGVGTKLLVAQELECYEGLGIDLVAMCVNDLIVCGAEPLSFLDYIACSKINEDILHKIIQSIVKGCEEASCQLSGGETAEMPGLYHGNDFDLAGFAVGMVEKDEMLPMQNKMKASDVIIGLPSTGIHSNGLSLARKIINKKDWDILLTPTKIYVKELKALLASKCILGAAHITGGGLENNLKRVYPASLSAHFTYDWDVPEVFQKIQEEGGIAIEEMRNVFNMGIGMAVIVPYDKLPLFFETAAAKQINAFPIGELRNG